MQSLLHELLHIDQEASIWGLLDPSTVECRSFLFFPEDHVLAELELLLEFYHVLVAQMMTHSEQVIYLDGDRAEEVLSPGIVQLKDVGI